MFRGSLVFLVEEFGDKILRAVTLYMVLFSFPPSSLSRALGSLLPLPLLSLGLEISMDS